ncbi:MAG: hydantoinase/oxoprolinase family protein [Pseudorhodoplanes sp.]
MSYIIAVDSGGTFCDCVAFDSKGKVTRAKAPSTPPNFDQGVLDSVTEVAKRIGRPLKDVLGETALFAHGTTVATNVLITRTGAKTALVTTKGHEDVMLIGRTAQKVAGLSETEIINVARLSKANPLVPRPRIHGVDERVDRAGRVVVPFDIERARPILQRLKDDGVESVAISFLWSFLNTQHEKAVKDWIEREIPGLIVSASHELAPLIREYERTATTVMNAYLTPAVARYLKLMRQKLIDAGLTGPVAVMHSSGGLSSVEEASARGAALLVSGPAGGALGAQALGAKLGIDKILTADVGGTSFDVGILIDGKPGYSDGPIIDKYPLALPVIDVTSIGAGGGSIGWVEAETGVLRVGPQSAGARPGPACYEKGGHEPTVTDANLVLGRLNPDFFLGGRMRLYPEKARQAIKSRIADPLGMSVEDAAAAMIEIVDAQMSDIIRKVTVERGQDPANFTVFSYGGAGGLHCDAYSSVLGCREVVVPSVASVFSAFGIAGSDAKRVMEMSDPVRFPFDLARFREHFQTLENAIVAQMKEQRLPIGKIKLTRFVHLLFKGQVHTVRVPVTDFDLKAPDRGRGILWRFVELYELRYGQGTAYTEAGVEAIALSVEAVADLPKPKLAQARPGNPSAAGAIKERRKVYLHERKAFVEIPIYSGSKLRSGHRLKGPALIEGEDMTVLVRSGHALWIDPYQNLRIDLSQSPSPSRKAKRAAPARAKKKKKTAKVTGRRQARKKKKGSR